MDNCINIICINLLLELNFCGLNSVFLFSQGNYNTANMAGCFKGAQTAIQSKQSKFLYSHCTAHSLNLAVSSACNIQFIRNCFGVIEKMLLLF